MNIYKIFLIAFLFVFISCNDDGSSNDKLFRVYEDIAFARESIDNIDSANVAVDSILKSYGYTEAQFRKEIFELRKDNPDEFIQIIDSVKKNAMQRSQKLDSIKNLELESEPKASSNSEK